MMRGVWRALGLCVLLLGAGAQAGDIVVASRQGRYEQVMEDLVFAIQGRSLVINHVNHLAAMLERTGRDLGISGQVYLQGEQIEFCKSDLSREIMSADPANMVFCPFTLSIYTLPAEPDRVYIAFRRPVLDGASPGTRAGLEKIERLLADIVDEALQ